MPALRPWHILVIWLLAGLALLCLLDRPPVQRTQEARVLVGAREMLGKGLRDWMVPRVNGRMRLQKPPLAYWISAAGMSTLGNNEWGGRVPHALLGWLTVGVTYAAGAWLLGRRGGLISAGVLLGSYLFFRHVRLAETDGPLVLLVTAATYFFWRALAADAQRHDRRLLPDAATAACMWASALACGLAAMVKGPAAAYPLIFFVSLALVRRQWRTLARWLASGAPLLIAAVAVPWYLYAGTTLGWHVFLRELSVATAGDDHWAPPWFYIPWLLAGPAPWTGFVVVGLVLAAAQRRTLRSQGLLVWLGSILLPLCINGNKQPHYLLPAMPVLALLAGWAIQQALRDPPTSALRLAVQRVFAGTLVVSLAAAAAMPFVASAQAGPLAPMDWAVAAAIAGGALFATLVWALRGLCDGLLTYAWITAALMPLIFGGWLPALEPASSRTIAAQIREETGAGPYCFYGQRDSLTLSFALGAVIPTYGTPAELLQALQRQPGLVVITQDKHDNTPPPLPPGFIERARVKMEEQTVRAWRPWRGGPAFP